MSDTSLVEDECEEQASQLLEERRGDGNEQDDQKNVTAVHLNQLFYRGTVGKEQVVFSSFPKDLSLGVAAELIYGGGGNRIIGMGTKFSMFLL